ncbi:MAG: sugar transferase, partial [Acidobacteriota bacterium]
MSAYLPHRARLRTLLALADTAGLAVAAWLAYALRFGEGAFGNKWQALIADVPLVAWAWIVALALITAAELYEPEILYRRREMALRVLVVLGGWAMAIVLADFLRSASDVGRGVLGLTVLLWGTQLITVRFVMTSWMRSRRRFVALVVGDPERVAEFRAAIDQRESAPWRLVDASDVPVESIAEAIEQHEASLVIVRSGDDRARKLGHDLAHLHFSGVPVVASSEIWAWLEERLPLEAMTPALFLHQPGFGAVHYTLLNRINRIVDLLLALLILIVSAPLFLLAALAVVLTDGFPVLYRQERLGQHGRAFTMLKLRTMRRDAERAGPSFAAERDPRILPVGHLLRHLRIDELPQLINVLKGEMSLVGPRPERPEFVEQLTEKIPFYAFRMAVPPGITGWAQVNVPYAR